MSANLQGVDNGIVRILRPDGSTSGAGFLVSHTGLSVTCSHVIQDHEAQNRGEAKPEAVTIAFYNSGAIREGTVIPASWSSVDAEDIAFLQIKGAVPTNACPLPLGQSRGSAGHPFVTLGFPWENPQGGIRGDGAILGDTLIQGARVLQISSNQVKPGFSGAPVWDKLSQRVVGMVTKILIPDEYGRLSETAFITPSEALREIHSALEIKDICPYIGLSAFTENYAEFYFGRDALIQELCEQLRRNPQFLAVIGSSGSGKSSLVQAGLLPQLRHGKILNFNPFIFIALRPGKEPLASLASALFSAGFEVAENIDPRHVLNSYLREKKDDRGRPILFIDQFEELFAISDEDQSEAFLKYLYEMVDNYSPITLILTLRADFYDHLLRSPLGKHLKKSQINIRPMAIEELQEVILRPAQAVGLNFESGLVNQIAEDAFVEKHSLPLLEFALTQLWERHHEGWLARNEYIAIGKVAGAVSLWASDILSRITEQERDLVRKIFSRLVQVSKSIHDDDVPITKKRVPLHALLTLPEGREAIYRLVMKLASAHLLVTDRNLRTGRETVEIVHEALLSTWNELAYWVQDQREFLLWLDRLNEKIREFEDQGRDRGAVLQGANLAEAEKWRAERGAELNRQEREYIEVSIVHRDQERCAREAARKRIIFGLAGGIVVTTFLTALSAIESFRAKNINKVAISRLLAANAIANFEKDPSLALLLAAHAYKTSNTPEAWNSLLYVLKPNLFKIIYTALRPVRALSFSPDEKLLATGSDDGNLVLWDGKTYEEICETHVPYGGEAYGSNVVQHVAFTKDGAQLFIKSTLSGSFLNLDGYGYYTLDILSLKQRPVPQPGADANDPTQSEGNCGTPQEIKEPNLNYLNNLYGSEISPAKAMDIIGHNEYITSAAINKRYGKLAVGMRNGAVAIWNTNKDFPSSINAQEIEFSNDGNILRITGKDGKSDYWEVNTGQQVTPKKAQAAVWTTPKRPTQPVAKAFSDLRAYVESDGLSAAAGEADLLIQDHVKDRYLYFPGGNGSNYSALAINKRWLAIGDCHSGDRHGMNCAQGEINVINIKKAFEMADPTNAYKEYGKSGKTMNDIFEASHIELIGHRDMPFQLAFNQDGSLLASMSRDHEIRLWDTARWDRVHDLAPLNNPKSTPEIDTPLYAITSTSPIASASASQDSGALNEDLSNKPLQFLKFRPPKGSQLAYIDSKGEVHLIDVSPALLQERACQVASRNMTRSEWLSYVGNFQAYDEANSTCPEFDLPTDNGADEEETNDAEKPPEVVIPYF